MFVVHYLESKPFECGRERDCNELDAYNSVWWCLYDEARREVQHEKGSVRLTAECEGRLQKDI